MKDIQTLDELNSRNQQAIRRKKKASPVLVKIMVGGKEIYNGRA